MSRNTVFWPWVLRDPDHRKNHLLIISCHCFPRGSRVARVGPQVKRPALAGRNFGFWISDFGFRISDFGFRISDFGFRISDFGFAIAPGSRDGYPTRHWGSLVGHASRVPFPRAFPDSIIPILREDIARECPLRQWSETARPVNATRFRTWVLYEHINLSAAHAMKNPKSEIRNSKSYVLDTPGRYQHTTLGSVISARENRMPSRPRPELLMPPKGMESSR